MMHDEQLREKVLNNGIRLSDQVEDVDETIRGDGATPAQRYSNMIQLVREIVGGMTDQEKEIATWMVRDMTELGEIGNEVSRRIDGVDWFLSESYFPSSGAVDRKAAGWEEIDPTLGKKSGPGVAKMADNFGLTKERTPHNNVILIGNSFKIYEEHIRDMSVFVSWSELQRDINSVLNDRDVRKAIVQRWGLKVIPQIKEYIEFLTYQKGASDSWGSWQKAAALIQRNFSLSILGFRLSSIALNRVGGTLMNATWLAANHPAALPAYLARAANPLRLPFKLLTGDSKAIRDELLKDGYFYDRWKADAFRVFGQTPREEQGNLTGATKEWKEIGKLRYRQLQQLGVSGMAWAEMRNVIELVQALESTGIKRNRAVEMVENITRDTQNPSTALEETVMYRGLKKSGFAGLFLPFMGQPTVIADYVGQQLDIARDEAKTNKKAAMKRRGIVVIGALITGLYAVVQRAIVRLASKGLLTGEEPDDEEKEQQTLYLVGDAIQELADIGIPGLGRIADIPITIADALRTGKRDGFRNLQRPGSIIGRISSSGIRAIRELLEWKQTKEIDVDEVDIQVVKVGAGLAGEPIGKSEKKKKKKKKGGIRRSSIRRR